MQYQLVLSFTAKSAMPIEQESGSSIQGFELARLAPGRFQRITVDYNHVTLCHDGIADLNMLERMFSFGHFPFTLFYHSNRGVLTNTFRNTLPALAFVIAPALLQIHIRIE
jgi:hypothetical protein